jgi:predicted transcriptional regulator
MLVRGKGWEKERDKQKNDKGREVDRGDMMTGVVAKQTSNT